MRRRAHQVPSITSAASSSSSQIDHRERDYLISMAIRSVCFIGFVVVDHPIRWVMAAGAVFLPYFAVVVGNAIVRRPEEPSPYGFTAGELEGAPQSTDSQSESTQDPTD